jgi:hypothetical protein
MLSSAALPDDEATAPASAALSSSTSTTTLLQVESDAKDTKKEDSALTDSSESKEKLAPKSPTASTAVSSSSSTTTLVEADSDAKPANAEATETKKADSTDPPPTEDKDKFDPKSLRGWVRKPPFWMRITNSSTTPNTQSETIWWEDMTWKQKMVWRRAFVREYFSETKLCLPYVRKLFLLIFRLSPWRTVVLLLANTLRGLIPALNLQTRGNFILMVCTNALCG